MVQAQILELLEDLRAKLGLSLILITHDLSVIAETCDRVMVMYAGRVAEEGPVAEVFTRPRHPYTQKLLAAFPNIHADRRTLEVIPGSPPDLRNPPPGCRFAPRCPFAMDDLHGGRAAGGHVRMASGSRAISIRRRRPRGRAGRRGRRPGDGGRGRGEAEADRRGAEAARDDGAAADRLPVAAARRSRPTRRRAGRGAR